MKFLVISLCLIFLSLPRSAAGENWVFLGEFEIWIWDQSDITDWKIDTDSIEKNENTISYTISIDFFGPVYHYYSTDCLYKEVLAMYWWDEEKEDWIPDSPENLWEWEPAHAEVCRLYY